MRTRSGRFAIGAACLAWAVALSGCGAPSDAEPTASSSATPDSASQSSSGTEQVTTSLPRSAASFSGTQFPITVTDWAGHQTTFEQPPQRVVLASGSSLNLWYDAGGTAVGAVNQGANNKLKPEVAEQLQQVPQLGPSRAIDAEKLIALNPDLVITTARTQEKLIETMRSMGIATISVTLTSFDDLQMSYEMLGALNGTHQQASAAFAQIKADTEAVIAKTPKQAETKIAIVSVNPNGLTVKTAGSVAGDMANQLGLINVVNSTGTQNAEDAPIDLEYLASNQPDIILVTSHAGSNEAARAKMQDNFDNNTAWQAIDAVRDGKVHYLPQEYFLLHPGPFYAEAMQIMAASVYPEVFGTVGG